MAEYIEREAVKAEFRKNFAYGQNENFAKWLERVACEIVNKIPVANVQPVKHAIWIITDDGYCRCENCYKKAPYFGDDCVATDFCPHCGAKMDGGAENG